MCLSSSCLLLLIAIASFNTVQGQGNGAIRLIISGSVSTTSTGIVEIYYNSAWGNICDDSSFGYSEANVICHQLGYSGVASYGNVGSTLAVGTDTRSTAIEDVSCSTSSYLALLQCSTTASYSSFCSSDSRDAYVSCYTTRIWSSPYSGQLRLVGGTYSNYGRLEVYCNSQWGTVCDDSFGSTDATVACRQLGYSRPYSYSGNLAGSSSQPIWLDNVLCTSSSTSCLAYCQNCPSSQFHNCFHSEDVALGCDFGSTYSKPYTTTYTCQYADSITNNIGAIIGGVVAAFIVCIICTVAIIAIPICICCCLGVGLGAAAGSSGGRRKIVSHTAANTSHVTAVSSTTGTGAYPTQQAGGYSTTSYSEKDPAAYPPQPALGYPPQPTSGYQPAPGYPPQQYPSADPAYPPPYGFQPQP